MPNKWTGTPADRLARLDQADRRCDGQNRHCTRSAVEQYTLLAADGNFNALPGAQPVIKKCCGYHRAQFLGRGIWAHVSTRKLSLRLPRPGETFERGRPAA